MVHIQHYSRLCNIKLYLLQALRKLQSLSHKFVVFRSRVLHMKAYWKHLSGKSLRARKLLGRAIQEGWRNGCLFDADWAKASQKAWFGRDSNSEDMFFVLN